MDILKSINKVRRDVMRKMAKNIGRSSIDRNIHLKDAGEIKRILISRPNGRLGNLLLITPILQEVTANFPNCKVDLFVKGSIAPILFKNYTNVDRIIQLPKKPFKSLFKYAAAWVTIKRRRYDIAINVVNYSSSGRLSTKFANAKHKFFGEVSEGVQAKYKDYKHIAKHPVYGFREYLVQLGYPNTNKPVPSLDLKLSPDEIADGKKLLRDLVNNNKETISIFTYATGHKCHSEDWWAKFYKQLKKTYPDHNIIEILPVENVSQIAFKAPAFYSKDIREIGSLIANTKVFIGADSGIMHLASAVQTTTVGLFSTSDPDVYKPYNNNSIAIDTKITTVNKCVKIVTNILAAAKTFIGAAMIVEEAVMLMPLF